VNGVGEREGANEKRERRSFALSPLSKVKYDLSDFNVLYSEILQSPSIEAIWLL
jgi:hypothetical protein